MDVVVSDNATPGNDGDNNKALEKVKKGLYCVKVAQSHGEPVIDGNTGDCKNVLQCLGYFSSEVRVIRLIQ